MVSSTEPDARIDVGQKGTYGGLGIADDRLVGYLDYRIGNNVVVPKPGAPPFITFSTSAACSVVHNTLEER